MNCLTNCMKAISASFGGFFDRTVTYPERTNAQLFFFLLVLLISPLQVQSQTTTYETIPVGSYIIDMGRTPQTAANTLRAYGLVYDLLSNEATEIKWAINPSKTKDGVDFTHAGEEFRGGPFIIRLEELTPSIKTRIANFLSQAGNGQITVVTTTTTFVAPIAYTLTDPPKWTLDKNSGDIAVPYFALAGIPTSAYGGSSSANWKTPSQLNECDDIYVLPHLDTKTLNWTNYENLGLWVENFRGSVWAGCQSGGNFEDLQDPLDPSINLHFLTPEGLIPENVNYEDKRNGTTTNNFWPADPVAQYLGSTDGAQDNGSQQWYLPQTAKNGSVWRPTTRRIVEDPINASVPSLSQGPPSNNLYGHAFGKTNFGLVMYQGGHKLNQVSTPAAVAAMRMFFNFAFFTVEDRKPKFDIGLGNEVPIKLFSGETTQLDLSLDFSVDYGSALIFEFKWTSSCSDIISFNDNTLENPTMFISPVAVDRECEIFITVTDQCGRKISRGFPVIVTQPRTVLELDKQLISITDKDGITRSDGKYSALDDILTYTYTITNKGNVSLPGPFVFSDDRISNVSNGTGPLDPNFSLTVGATYTVTIQDLVNAKVTNKAHATPLFNGNNVVSNRDSVTVEGIFIPLLSLTKTGILNDLNSNCLADAGETISYSFLVTNEGNVDLENVIVTDPKLTIQGSPIALAVGTNSGTHFTGTYTLTQDDINLGYVDNTAQAT